ncbi:MAG: calcium-binding protein, partial [Sulfuricurvum sp.]|nr:calcium-binding protein [Sulfuricurvum sp.]
MAVITSASVSGNTLTIMYDEAMTYQSVGGLLSSTGSSIDVIGFTGNGTATWTMTLSASIATTDYIIGLSFGNNSVGTYSGLYLSQGTAFIGSTGATTFAFADGFNNSSYPYPMSFFGGNGADTIITAPWENNYISLTESVKSSDTVGFGDQQMDLPLYQMDLVDYFDVSGTTTNDKLSLLSGTIVANTVGYVNGTDVGMIGSHSITAGIITFKDTAGNTISSLTLATATASTDAYHYLETNIATAGMTMAFIVEGEPGSYGLGVFQKGATGVPSFIVSLDHIPNNVTLSNNYGVDVVQIVDTAAPDPQDAAATSNGLDLHFPEIVTNFSMSGIKLYKNGTDDMGALSSSITHGGDTVSITSSTVSLSANDFVVMDSTAVGANFSATDNFSNSGTFNPGNKMAFGGTGDNSINLALLSGVTEAQGGNGNDTLTGDANNNYLDGGVGNDILYGGGGDDELDGGAGNDILDGGTGNDQMSGRSGNDTYILRDVGDQYWENDSNIVTGGNDTVQTYLTNTNLNFYIENLRIMNTGAANAYGNELDNTIYAGIGDNIINGQNGHDTLSYINAASAVSVSLASTVQQATGGSGNDTVSNFENLTGSNFADILTGDTNANTINGGLGNDTIDGGAGADTMVGGAGNDTYYVDDIGDLVYETTIIGGSIDAGGSDTVISTVSYTLGSYTENLRLNTTAAVNGTGNTLNNTIYAGDGDNILNGGAGVDTLSYSFATAGVTVSLAKTTAQATVGSGSDTMIGFENLTGSAFNDTLVGNAAANVLVGGSGNDVLSGAAGADTMVGGAGNDTYYVDDIGDLVYETTIIGGSIDAGGSDTVI